MSIDTWHKDWVESPDYNKLKLEDEIRLYEKFVERIEDVISTKRILFFTKTVFIYFSIETPNKAFQA